MKIEPEHGSGGRCDFDSEGRGVQMDIVLGGKLKVCNEVSFAFTGAKGGMKKGRLEWEGIAKTDELGKIQDVGIVTEHVPLRSWMKGDGGKFW